MAALHATLPRMEAMQRPGAAVQRPGVAAGAPRVALTTPLRRQRCAAARPVLVKAGPDTKTSEDHDVLQAYATGRVNQVAKYFPKALGVDDFMSRVEMALYAFGFDGDNTIACANLCRDEVTVSLKHKIDEVFGWSFSTNGLGGVITCGTTGIGAGLSHSPISTGGKERYVFFSFPHIGIDAAGSLGGISRPNRQGASSACGALKAALGELQGSGLEGLAAVCKCPGEHDAKDPEYSILKQRLVRRLRYEGAKESDVQSMDLAQMTKVAERTITDDLEYLIAQAVDPAKADYAVVTGVQIHSWSSDFDNDSPNLEFVAPCSVYVVVGGERIYLDLTSVPAMTPRQIGALASAGAAAKQAPLDFEGGVFGARGNLTTVRAIDSIDPYRLRGREQRKQAAAFKELIPKENLDVDSVGGGLPAWQNHMTAQAPYKAMENNSTVLDEIDGTKAEA